MRKGREKENNLKEERERIKGKSKEKEILWKDKRR